MIGLCIRNELINWKSQQVWWYAMKAWNSGRSQNIKLQFGAKKKSLFRNVTSRVSSVRKILCTAIYAAIKFTNIFIRFQWYTRRDVSNIRDYQDNTRHELGDYQDCTTVRLLGNLLNGKSHLRLQNIVFSCLSFRTLQLYCIYRFKLHKKCTVSSNRKISRNSATLSSADRKKSF